jgi:sRNA-binding protein
MGGVVRKVTGEDEKRKLEEAARKIEAEKLKEKNERNEQMRTAGEAAASSVRARRRRSGLLETASVIGGEQTLGSGTAL